MLKTTLTERILNPQPRGERNRERLREAAPGILPRNPCESASLITRTCLAMFQA